jgi:hypothetical protein
VSSLILSVTATAASTQPNTMILSILLWADEKSWDPVHSDRRHRRELEIASINVES